jgi:hypothetical protein
LPGAVCIEGLDALAAEKPDDEMAERFLVFDDQHGRMSVGFRYRTGLSHKSAGPYYARFLHFRAGNSGYAASRTDPPD